MPIYRRLPKRGFNNADFGTEYQVVNVGKLARFEAGSEVGPEEMRAASVVRKKGPVKVLATGEIDMALTVRAHRFSKEAARKIEAAGGRAEVI